MSKHDPRPIQEVLEAVRQAELLVQLDELQKLDEARTTLTTDFYNAIMKVGLPALMKKHDAYVNKKQSDKKFTTISTPSPDFNTELDKLIQKNKSKLKKFESIDERAALVMNQTHIIDVVLKDLHALLLKQMNKGNLEVMNNVARLVGLKVTTKGQERNKAFMYDLEKGFKRK